MTLTAKQRRDRIKSLIQFYERRGWDWTSACAFECCMAMRASLTKKEK